MKTISAFWISLVLAGSFILAEQVPPAFETAKGGPATAAEDEFDPFDPVNSAPKLIRVQVEHIELSHKDLTRLLMEDKSKTSDATALRMKVQEMVEKDQAKVIDTQIVVGTNGQRPSTQSRQDFIYPTRYEVVIYGAGPHKQLEVSGTLPLSLRIPTGFQTRNLGSNLESESNLAENEKTIGVKVFSDLTWYTGNTVWTEGKDALGNIDKVAMPNFFVMNTNANVTCIPGQYLMISAPSPKNAEGKLDPDRKVMVFVKCDVLPVIP